MQKWNIRWCHNSIYNDHYLLFQSGCSCSIWYGATLSLHDCMTIPYQTMTIRQTRTLLCYLKWSSFWGESGESIRTWKTGKENTKAWVGTQCTLYDVKILTSACDFGHNDSLAFTFWSFNPLIFAFMFVFFSYTIGLFHFLQTRAQSASFLFTSQWCNCDLTNSTWFWTQAYLAVRDSTITLCLVKFRHLNFRNQNFETMS